MKPTDQQINEAVARVSGWTKCKDDDGLWRIIMPDGKIAGYFQSRKEADADFWLSHPPGYCANRNLLPELWGHLAAVDRWCGYIKFLTEFKPGPGFAQIDVYLAITAPLRDHCIAFLNATSNWPEEWSEDD